MAGPRFIGIMGYLIGLQQIENRGRALGQLRILLNKINKTFADSIELKFIIVSDTEFKGAVSRNFPLQDFLTLYHQEFGRNVGTHFGIGLGKLGFKRERKPGGCFYSASKAMAKAVKNGEYLIFNRFEMDKALNALFYFIHEMDEKMTDRQRQIVEVYRRNGDIVSVASQLYLPKQAVVDSLKAVNYEVYEAAWRGLEQLLRFEIKVNKK